MKSVGQLCLILLVAGSFGASAFAQVNHGGPAGAPGPVYGSPVYRGNSPYPATSNSNPGYNNGPNYGNSGPSYGNGSYNNSPRNQGGYGVQIHVGTYPNSPSYPNYPSYPSSNYPSSSYPNQNLGPCSISTNYNGGMSVYTVYDGYGNVMITTPDYNEAYQVAMNSVAARACSYVASNSGNNNGYPPSQNYCQVMPGQNAYGQQFYRVVDRAGRILLNTSSYYEAQREVQSNPGCYQAN